MISALDLWAKNEFSEGWKGVLSVERGAVGGEGKGIHKVYYTAQSTNL
jgi:hypothetical protein